VHHEPIVVALAAHGAVLMLAEAPEIERLAVDQEAGILNPNGAYADRQRVSIDE